MQTVVESSINYNVMCKFNITMQLHFLSSKNVAPSAAWLSSTVVAVGYKQKNNIIVGSVFIAKDVILNGCRVLANAHTNDMYLKTIKVHD